MSLRVLRPGALTTVQDTGRTGFRHLGAGASGALDGFSSRVANLLVGNDPDAALLEMTLAGPTLAFDGDVCIAITGAAVDARVGDLALPGWRPIDVPAGSELRVGACRDGARAYLAVRGGFATPPVMGSRATDLRGAFGGLEGRPLRSGDRLDVETPARRVDTARSDPAAVRIARWWVDPRPDLDLSQAAAVATLPGRDALDDPRALFSHEWRVAAASDRQGLRLDGPALQPADRANRISAPVAPGTIQLPPDGRPIVLLGEAQTVGGYPCIGHVAGADLPRLAQCRPGDALRFAPIDRDAALARLRAQAQRLARMALAIDSRRR